jgi:hypothetical protein
MVAHQAHALKVVDSISTLATLVFNLFLICSGSSVG